MITCLSLTTITDTNKAGGIDYLPLTYYDLDGGKEFVSTHDAVAVAVADERGFAMSCVVPNHLCGGLIGRGVIISSESLSFGS